MCTQFSKESAKVHSKKHQKNSFSPYFLPPAGTKNMEKKNEKYKELVWKIWRWQIYFMRRAKKNMKRQNIKYETPKYKICAGGTLCISTACGGGGHAVYITCIDTAVHVSSTFMATKHWESATTIIWYTWFYKEFPFGMTRFVQAKLPKMLRQSRRSSAHTHTILQARTQTCVAGSTSQ